MTDTLPAILSELSEPVALFLDFDGTLVEIAPTPDSVTVPDRLVVQLSRLEEALEGALAIITGRMIADIDAFLSPSQFSIAGSHGAEQRHRGVLSGPSRETGAHAATIAERVQEALGTDRRILIETKNSGVAVHFRAAPEREDEVRAALNEAVASVPGFPLIEGKKVIEARAAGTSKGEAVRALMDQPPFAGRLPVFIGDDVTDEDGFAAVDALGGFGVKIGGGPTRARFRLADVPAAFALLEALAKTAGAQDRSGPQHRSGAEFNQEATAK